MITPLIRSSTLICAFSSVNILEPCMRHARWLTGMVSSSDSRPDRIRSKTMYMVMILLIDDVGMRWLAFFSNSVVPVDMSIKIACLAMVSSEAADDTDAMQETMIPTIQAIDLRG